MQEKLENSFDYSVKTVGKPHLDCNLLTEQTTFHYH